MTSTSSPRQLREEIVGRTISGVIARPGKAGEPPVVLMLRFEDGSVVEFVSPRSDRLLKRSLRGDRRSAAADLLDRAERTETAQLSLEGMAQDACRYSAATTGY
ncbi:MAG: hypothetical protein EA419_07265 [Wenzhouxiangella sp.]|nr:MAG: hypothetical protein EA419_07265 [Wenzhouxiangella sp.]